MQSNARFLECQNFCQKSALTIYIDETKTFIHEKLTLKIERKNAKLLLRQTVTQVAKELRLWVKYGTPTGTNAPNVQISLTTLDKTFCCF